MLDRDDVVWAYRMLLRREAESEDVVRFYQRRCASRTELIEAFRLSPEYIQTNQEARGWVIAPVFDGNLRMWLDLGDLYVSRACLNGNYSAEETQLIRRLLGKGGTFLDIGANVGWFSMLAASIVGPSGRVYAFEPRPETAHYLRDSIAINSLGQVISLSEHALWDRSGEKMRLVWAPGTANPGGSHLSFEATEGESSIVVESMMIDDLHLPAADLIKVDVEGAEYRVLKGAEAALRRYMPPIISEVHSLQLSDVSSCSVPEYMDYLTGLGYDCFVAEGPERGQAMDKNSEYWRGKVRYALFLPHRRVDELWLKAFESG